MGYEKAMVESFLECDDMLDKQSHTPNGFEVNLSGSTVCTILFDGNRLHCANLGDSRAIKV